MITTMMTETLKKLTMKIMIKNIQKMANLLLLTKLQIISILQVHVNKKLKEKYRQALP
jgi:hypothetical protein